jgi:hypothetical protein
MMQPQRRTGAAAAAAAAEAGMIPARRSYSQAAGTAPSEQIKAPKSTKASLETPGG